MFKGGVIEAMWTMDPSRNLVQGRLYIGKDWGETLQLCLYETYEKNEEFRTGVLNTFFIWCVVWFKHVCIINLVGWRSRKVAPAG